MQKKKYGYLLFDADHTLLNYVADERGAYEDLYAKLGVTVSEELLKASRKHSEEAWTDAGLYEVHSPKIQKEYHALYRSHTEEIFARVFAQFPTLGVTLSAKKTGLLFLECLRRKGVLMDGARETLQTLSKKYSIGIATNGLSAIQRARLCGLEKWVDKVFVSEEMGVIKPLEGFFNYILTDLGVSADECLMIGDSLSSDIAGAKTVGMDCCWFNPTGMQNKTPFTPDYQITKLQELIEILG